jgi:acetoacetate decarboxylase
MSHNECLNSIIKLKTICKRLGVPIADEKTEGLVTSMEYLGLTIDTESMSVKIPEEKMKEILKKLNEVAFSKKVILKQL